MIKVLLFLVLLFIACAALDKSLNTSSTTVRRRSMLPLLYDLGAPKTNSSNKLNQCLFLKGFKHQRRQCQKRRGLEAVLLEAKKLVVRTCQESFRYDTWNCSYDKNQFKKIDRETAFMQSLAAAALMFTVTQACSNNTLAKCKCSSTKHWMGGSLLPDKCNDSSKTGKIIVRNFLMVERSTNKKTQALNHNVLYGMKTVLENYKEHCGHCANCAWRLCEKRIQSFSNVVEKLKLGYHTAIKLKTRNVTVTATVKRPIPRNRLLYLAESPNFCPYTAGRRCLDEENCATLCCGRGKNTRTVTIINRCHYRWTDCCYTIESDICREEKQVYECK